MVGHEKLVGGVCVFGLFGAPYCSFGVGAEVLRGERWGAWTRLTYDVATFELLDGDHLRVFIRVKPPIRLTRVRTFRIFCEAGKQIEREEGTTGGGNGRRTCAVKATRSTCETTKSAIEQGRRVTT